MCVRIFLFYAQADLDNKKIWIDEANRLLERLLGGMSADGTWTDLGAVVSCASLLITLVGSLCFSFRSLSSFSFSRGYLDCMHASIAVVLT